MMTRRVERWREKALSLLPWTLLLTSGLSCARPDNSAEAAGPTGKVTAVGQAPTDEALDTGLIPRALGALESKLPKDATFLEIRVEPTTVELQLVSDGAVTSLRYRETTKPGKPQLKSPVGTVDPPTTVPILGKGDLSENAFSAREVDLLGIARAFPVAKKAVDPVDGRIERVIVRRYLPFGTAVRARIYVASPRMPGSIDTNGKGIPLRSCY